jgi:hypothetical protein
MGETLVVDVAKVGRPRDRSAYDLDVRLMMARFMVDMVEGRFSRWRLRDALAPAGVRAVPL